MGGEVIIAAILTGIGFVLAAATAALVAYPTLRVSPWRAIRRSVAVSAIVSVAFIAAFFSGRWVASWQFLLGLAVVQVVVFLPFISAQPASRKRIGVAVLLAVLQPGFVVAAWFAGFWAMGAR
jgi:hypothetical protein